MSTKTQRILILAFLGLILVGWAIADNPDSRHKKIERTPGGASAPELCEVKIPDGTPAQIIDYEGFTVSFNPDMHQPNYVAWELTGEEAEGTVARGNNFAQDFDIDGCASLDDYRRSGFDRGHMAPAGDMKWSRQAMNDCFLLTNMCPQAQKLNTGAWKTLEENCRAWARRDSALVIICGPVLTDRLTQTIGQTGIPVPKRFFKVVLALHANPPRAIGFLMNNGRVDGGLQNAAVPVDEVEAITGYDFFSSLPDDLENELEAQNRFSTWTKR